MEDTFLNYDKFIQLYDSIKVIIDKLPSSKTKKTTYIKKNFPFESCFKTQGVYGITGLLNYKNNKIVFKTSVDVDLTTEHESFIIKELNPLRQYCPHFVGFLGSFPFVVSDSFIDQEEDSSQLWDKEEEHNNIPSTVMLLEYVGKYDLELLCKQDNISAIAHSQIVMVLTALQISQQKKHFVHYDLHLENIILRECDPSALFAYRFNTSTGIKSILIPTHGYFPVIIDMGSSYIDNYIGKNVATSIGHYKSGLQSTEWDPLNDTHHFMLRCIDILEISDYRWRDIGTKIMYNFKHIPIWRAKGWKQLTTDIHKILSKKIFEYYPSCLSIPIFVKYNNEILETLSYGTTVHWSSQFNSEEDLKINIIHNFTFLTNILTILDTEIEIERHILYILKEWVLFCSSNELNNLPKWKSTISEHVGKIPKIDWITFFDCIKQIIKCITHVLYTENITNIEIIEKSYEQTKLKEPHDIIHLLQQHFPNRFDILNKNTKIYTWDSINNSHSIINASSLKLDSNITFKDHSHILNKIFS